jgi:hypothetical protein
VGSQTARNITAAMMAIISIVSGFCNKKSVTDDKLAQTEHVYRMNGGVRQPPGSWIRN